MKGERVLIADTSAILYRFAFALKDMCDKRGQPFGGIFGLMRMLYRTSKRYDISHILCAGDSAYNARKEKYPQYKALREKTPDFIVSQMILLRKILSIMNVPFISVDGYEADDIIATLSVTIGEKAKTKILSSDRDMGQLVSDNVHLLLMRSSGIQEIDGIKKYLTIAGILPSQYPDYIGLKGDQSNNIPGVLGIGEKTALKLLKIYNTLEDVYQHIDDIEANISKKLLVSKDIAFLSRSLAKMHYDVLIPELNWNKNNHEEWLNNKVLVEFMEREIGIEESMLLSFFEY